MRTLPRAASDDDIRALVVEWSELLAQKRYQDALELFPASAESQAEWTPQVLEAWIANYGSPEPIPGERLHELTSLIAREDAQDIIRNKINIDRENLYGLQPDTYLGMVHYHDVPLDGQRSDLTARFHIMKVDGDKLTLEFLDIHVM